MATIHLPCPVLTLVEDPAQSLVLTLATAVELSPNTPGEDRMYGPGRYRGVTTGATQRQVAVSADGIDPADTRLIEAWDGRFLCYRDDSGRKFFGWYRSPRISRHSGDDGSAVAFTVTELTYDETVTV